jgi:O-antigen/teichoic acid export membrane protein
MRPIFLRRWRRSRLVFNNALNLVLVPLCGVVVSVLVVRLASADVWGRLVGWLLLAQLGAHIVAWGNKDYLVRAFSRNPSQLAQAWQTSLFTRAVLLVPVGIWLALQDASPWRGLLLVLWCALLAYDQAFEAPVVYYKRFGLAAAVDLSAIVVQVAGVLLLGPQLDFNALVLMFIGSTLLKGVALSAIVARALFTRGWVGVPDWGELRAAFPLFLLTLSGLLASRVDVYAVNALLPREEVAQYQVYLNFLLMLQTGAAVLLLPFVKNLYRLGANAFLRQSFVLTGFGLAGALAGVAFIGWMFPLLYHWTLTVTQLALGVLLVLPAFYYVPVVYALYQQHRERWVVLCSFAGAAASLALSVWLLPRLGLVGGLVGNASGQLLIGGEYWYLARRMTRAQARPGIPSRA